jgi:deoxyribodipyrimidine photo-lyase
MLATMDWSDGVCSATRAGALARWQEFLPRVLDYGALRNRVQPRHPHVSRLSPAIRSRLVTTQELLEPLLATHPFTRIEKLVQELLWRDYWKGWLELRPGVWSAYRRELDHQKRHGDPAVLDRAQEVMAGRGGIAVMDRFARELIETGYLHNHARMWWAGYWIHVERLPWVLGADFFYWHLLDADPASNTLGWRWVAGLQTKGKTYLPRRSNLEKYCHPEWMEDTTGLDRIDDAVVSALKPATEPEPVRVPWKPLWERPELPAGRWGLWIHGEDLTPELSALGRLRPECVLTIQDDPLMQAIGLSEGRIAYLRHALADARTRAEAHFGCPVEHRSAGSLAHHLAEVARERQLDGWVAMRPAVGPLADALPEIESALQRDGRSIHWCRRRWDELRWPDASSGFFPFWEQTRARLASGTKPNSRQGLLPL